MVVEIRSTISRTERSIGPFERDKCRSNHGFDFNLWILLNLDLTIDFKGKNLVLSGTETRELALKVPNCDLKMSSTAGQSGKPLGDGVKTATSTFGICRSLIACLASGSRAADFQIEKTAKKQKPF